jgi:hypothetical protein
MVVLILALNHGDVQSTTGPTPPPGVRAPAVTSQSFKNVTILDVPSYLWYDGCGPTAAAMVMAYWDGKGYDLIPGSAVVQNDSVRAAIASPDHHADYSMPIDLPPLPLLADLSEHPLGDEHQDDSIADHMQTSRSSLLNRYGWSWLSDAGPGMVSYARSRLPDNVEVSSTMLHAGRYLTWQAYKAEIDAGRPMLLLVDSDGDGVSDHFVTAIGYGLVDDGMPYYASRDTWYDSVRWSPFWQSFPGRPFGVSAGVTFNVKTPIFLPLIIR